MKKMYVVQWADDSLEHATKMSPSRISTGIGNLGATAIGNRVKDPVVTAQASGKSASTIAEVAKIKQKWDKLIAQKESENTSYTKKIESDTKDRNLLISCNGQILDADTKKVLLNRINQLAANIRNYNTNITANKKAIANYNVRKTAEVNAAGGKI